MPGCIVSAITASFRFVEKRRRRATPVITSTFENVSDIGVYLGLCLGPPAKAGVRSKQGAVHEQTRKASLCAAPCTRNGGDRSSYRLPNDPKCALKPRVR